MRENATRDNHNAEVLKRFRAGETLSLLPPSVTWFPPRPIIKKDQNLVRALFGASYASPALTEDQDALVPTQSSPFEKP